jgi:pyridoxal phosphate enzyme (YggS family)
MSIAENLARVRHQMEEACRSAGRLPEHVRLMAVSKTQPVERIVEAYAAGARLFGENRVQEFAAKYDALAAAGIFSGVPAAAMHCIGPLQTNKARRAAQIFDAVDSVDSLRVAEHLQRAAVVAGKTLPILLEIKVSGEAAKHGLDPDGQELAEVLEHAPDWTHLHVRGLMTVPPYFENSEGARPYFRRLRLLRDALAQRYAKLQFDELSMGMSHDFVVAIAEGSTCVRIGTAIFGARAAQPIEPSAS